MCTPLSHFVRSVPGGPYVSIFHALTMARIARGVRKYSSSGIVLYYGGFPPRSLPLVGVPGQPSVDAIRKLAPVVASVGTPPKTGMTVAVPSTDLSAGRRRSRVALPYKSKFTNAWRSSLLIKHSAHCSRCVSGIRTGCTETRWNRSTSRHRCLMGDIPGGATL